MKPIEEKLEHVSKSTPDLPLHRAQLRRALLASKQFEGSTFSFMKKLLPVGLALAILITFNTLQEPDSVLDLTPTVSAQELVQDMISKLKTLSPEETEAIQEKLGTQEMASYFSEALVADSLDYAESQKIVNCDELDQLQYDTMVEVSIEDWGMESVPQCNAVFFPESDLLYKIPFGTIPDLTFVSFSNDSGESVIIGINGETLPVFLQVVGDDVEILEMTIEE